MSIFILILVLIAITIILVFLHELGHFVAAKMSGIYVGEFAVGFGPKLFSIKYKETYYSLRILPLGGYVSLLTKEILEKIEELKIQVEANPELKDEIERSIRPYSLDRDYSEDLVFESKSYFKRSVVILAGVTINVIFAFLIFWGSYSITGKRVITSDQYVSTYLNSDTNSSQNYPVLEQYNYAFATKTSDIVIGGIPLTEIDFGSIYIANQLISPFSSFLAHAWIVSDEESEIQEIEDALSLILDSGEESNPTTNEVYESCDKYEACYYGQEDFDNLINETNLNGYSISIYYTQTISLRFVNEDGSYYDRFGFADKETEGEAGNELTYLELMEVADYFNEEVNFYDSNVTDTNNNNIILYDNPVYNNDSRRENYWYSFQFSIPENFFNNETIFLYMSQYMEFSAGASYYVDYSVSESFTSSIVDTFKNMVVPFGYIFVQPEPSITIVDSSDDFSSINYANFNIGLATLSSMLVFFNMLPIPPLDGYKFYEMTYEKLRKKEIAPEKKRKLNKIGWSFIMIITVVLLVVPFIIY